MMDALGVSSPPCCDDVMASIDDQKSARRALSAHIRGHYERTTH
jgi:hypothetical protein